MGRLFWKFFFAFFLTLLTAGIGVGFAVSFLHDSVNSSESATGGLLSPPRRMHEGPPPSPPGVFIDAPPPHMPPPDGRPPPLLPILAALLGSLAASGLLAWYFSKPVRHLRWAFKAVADGKLDTRVQPLMAGRRDEIADLGRDFDQMTQQLRQLIESQQRLLHDVSHELRSPLARLQAAVGLARQNPVKVAATFDRIERETARLDKLVGELLTIARLDAGTAAEAKSHFDLVELLAAVADDARFEARANERDLEFQAEGEFFVEGRPELLHRAFENVLRNAIRYTVPGSAVEVRMEREPSGWAVVEICDAGPGIAAGELETVFQPFYRSRDRHGSGNGFGLGLAIARRAIEVHGGTIEAINRVAGGLCMKIALPEAATTAASIAASTE
jgi:signal transduction histidine kinase